MNNFQLSAQQFLVTGEAEDFSPGPHHLTMVFLSQT